MQLIIQFVLKMHLLTRKNLEGGPYFLEKQSNANNIFKLDFV